MKGEFDENCGDELEKEFQEKLEQKFHGVEKQ